MRSPKNVMDFESNVKSYRRSWLALCAYFTVLVLISGIWVFGVWYGYDLLTEDLSAMPMHVLAFSVALATGMAVAIFVSILLPTVPARLFVSNDKLYIRTRTDQYVIDLQSVSNCRLDGWSIMGGMRCLSIETVDHVRFRICCVKDIPSLYMHLKNMTARHSRLCPSSRRYEREEIR